MSIEIRDVLFNDMSKLETKIQLIDNSFSGILTNRGEMSSFSRENLLLKNTNMSVAG